MEIKITLPECQGVSTYKQLQGYLKQLELAVHHAQKAVENAENSGVEISESAFAVFEHPQLEMSLKYDEEKNAMPEKASAFLDNYYAELQNIELRINLD